MQVTRFALALALCLCSCASISQMTGATSVQAVLKSSQHVGRRLDDEERLRLKQEGREPASLAPRFQQPMRALNVSSRFGNRSSGFHSGIDYHTREGTPIYASEKGEVVFAGANIGGYGDTVILRHVGDTATLYAHASYIAVKEGDVVEKGQFIAYSGESGNATGPHLHFEIRKSGKPVNPTEWFAKSKAQAPRQQLKNHAPVRHERPDRVLEARRPVPLNETVAEPKNAVSEDEPVENPQSIPEEEGQDKAD